MDLAALTNDIYEEAMLVDYQAASDYAIFNSAV
jgi:hypothetical protein